MKAPRTKGTLLNRLSLAQVLRITVSAGSVFSFDGVGICVQPEN